jgi:hypothetical protein
VGCGVAGAGRICGTRDVHSTSATNGLCGIRRDSYIAKRRGAEGANHQSSVVRRLLAFLGSS